MNTLRRLLVAAASVTLLSLSADACSRKIMPEAPGDACEPDGEACPANTTCAPDAAGETSCQFPIGGACDPAPAQDFCAQGSVCGKSFDGSATCGLGRGAACTPGNAAAPCAGGLECAELTAGGHACFPPFVLKGKVFDAQTEAAIGGAWVLALDDTATAVTDVAISAADGNYRLSVPIARQADGSPVDAVFTLRASADGYQTFPGGIRTALPIATSDAVEGADGFAIQTVLTDIALLALPAAQQGLASISGAVLAGDLSAGVLVVAEPPSGAGVSAIADKSGKYTIFNVPAGSYDVHGYAAGVQLTPASVSVAAADLTGVDLATSSAALGTVSGSVNIVNAPGGSLTSVVLVVQSTFDDTFVRGDVPRGLRAPLSGPPNVSGAFTIATVPAGSYVVLAAFENDDLVRDPDPNIAGTQIVIIDMPTPGSSVALPTSFKVTEALPVVSPGRNGPEGVSGAPTFVWGDDSSEDYYSVVVYDAYGNKTWENLNVPKVTGGGDVTVTYAGPALESGMYYQFRATSWRSAGGTPGPISTTEDLRGVFFAQ